MRATTPTPAYPNKAAMDAMELLAIHACASAEKLLALQARSFKGATDNALGYLRALLQARGVADIAVAQANALQAQVCATAGYAGQLVTLANGCLPGIIKELAPRPGPKAAP